ncbi:MAG TPA: hypothetical protein VK829_18135 [Terriglobales bacterium]|nr:hypothetical protein [Terriglobales bacterium]
MQQARVSTASGSRSPLQDWFHAAMNVRGFGPRNVYDSFLQRAGIDGFAPILPAAIRGGTMASL